MPNVKNKRKAERIYNLKPTSITLKGYDFAVNDISNGGIGLILEDDSPGFLMGERLQNIPIPLKSGTVDVQGAVSHISITMKHTVCGIRFVFTGDEFKSVIEFKKERTLPPKEKKKSD